MMAIVKALAMTLYVVLNYASLPLYIANNFPVPLPRIICCPMRINSNKSYRFISDGCT